MVIYQKQKLRIPAYALSIKKTPAKTKNILAGAISNQLHLLVSPITIINNIFVATTLVYNKPANISRQ